MIQIYVIVILSENKLINKFYSKKIIRKKNNLKKSPLSETVSGGDPPCPDEPEVSTGQRNSSCHQLHSIITWAKNNYRNETPFQACHDYQMLSKINLIVLPEGARTTLSSHSFVLAARKINLIFRNRGDTVYKS